MTFVGILLPEILSICLNPSLTQLFSLFFGNIFANYLYLLGGGQNEGEFIFSASYYYI